MGAVISLIDWCVGRHGHHNRIQELEDKLLDYADNIENNTKANCFLDCCKTT